MGDDWKQVNIRVRESTKSEWQEYAKTEYGGMSDLVRTAVTREIGEDYDSSREGAESNLLTEVAESIDSLENTVSDMDNRLSVVRETVESSGPEFSFKAAVRETVPEQGGLYPGEIAARLDARESDVREKLDELEYIEEIREHYEKSEQDEPMYTRW